MAKGKGCSGDDNDDDDEDGSSNVKLHFNWVYFYSQFKKSASIIYFLALILIALDCI